MPNYGSNCLVVIGKVFILKGKEPQMKEEDRIYNVKQMDGVMHILLVPCLSKCGQV